MRFSIRTLLLFTTAVAVTVASLTYANPIIGDLFYTLGLLTIAFSILAAVYRRGPQRAFWVGYLLLFAGYFCHTAWPIELRSQWMIMMEFDSPAPGIATARLLSWSFEVVHSVPRFGSSFSTPNSMGEQYLAFMTIGHIAIAMLLGIIGGVVASRIALRAAVVKKEVKVADPS